MHRQGDGPQHLAVEIAEVRPCAGDIAGRAAHRHRTARWRHRQPRSRIEQPFQLALDLRPRVVVRLGRNRLAGQVAATAAPAVTAGGAVLGRGRHRVALRAGQRMNMKDRGTAAHDLYSLPVRNVAPLVTGGLGPGIEQRVQRPGPDAAVRRHPVASGLAEESHGCIAARRLVYSARGTGKPHREAGRRLDACHQYRRSADPGQRQRYRVHAAKPWGQASTRVWIDAGQSDVGPTLDQAHRGQTGSSLRPSQSRSRRSPEGRDLPRGLPRLQPRLLEFGQAAARERGEKKCKTNGSREPAARIGFLEAESSGGPFASCPERGVSCSPRYPANAKA